MTPRINITESPCYRCSTATRKLLRKGWRRAVITVYDEETGDKIVSSLTYLPPATNKEALEHMFELWMV